MEALERGRAAYDRKAWAEARGALREADEAERLVPDDLWRLAMSAYLTGRGDEFIATLERAHHAALEAAADVDAARFAFWLGLHLANQGEMARASGWFGRAGRLIEHAGGDYVERGYLMLPAALRQLASGEPEAAAGTALQAAAVAESFGDADLLSLALLLRGQALVRVGRMDEGLALMDEAMVAVAGGELSPVVTGLVYCAVIGACRRIYDLGRAHEWTAALSEWCEEQPELIAYTGECLTYRAEILQLRGDWSDALDEARRARDRLARGLDPRAAALALYQEGEVHRLRGEYAAAEEAYREAGRLGREPQPGLALLRLAQGDDDAAIASIRRALTETRDPLGRVRLLPAHVEISLATDDLDAARQSCDELAGIAQRFGAGVIGTLVAHARGAVALAAGDPAGALAPLRDACRGWRALEAPYEVARVRALLGRACRELGDDDAAQLELGAARSAFDHLGAQPDLDSLDATTRRAGAGSRARSHGLTPRQLEVLSLLATGRTNRAIADQLCISEKTVARHVADIFARLGLSTRAAATAYAYENDLVDSSA